MKCYGRGDGFAGIGFQFAAEGGLVGIDFDKCRDPDSGELADWAADIVRRFDTYAEVSPSGTGVKLWCRGKIPRDGKGKNRPFRTGAVEMYGQGVTSPRPGTFWSRRPRPSATRRPRSSG